MKYSFFIEIWCLQMASVLTLSSILFINNSDDTTLLSYIPVHKTTTCYKVDNSIWHIYISHTSMHTHVHRRQWPMFTLTFSGLTCCCVPSHLRWDKAVLVSLSFANSTNLEYSTSQCVILILLSILSEEYRCGRSPFYLLSWLYRCESSKCS